jgi:transcription-repair coupling factor (superfamily II helicase)
LPDWETLPYDAFSPHQDIVSDRLRTLHGCDAAARRGAYPIRTLLQRLAPPAFLAAHSLILNVGVASTRTGTAGISKKRATVTSDGFRTRQFAIRGSLVDVYPMGSPSPYRIDLFDDVVEPARSIPTQRTVDQIQTVEILPAKNFRSADAIALQSLAYDVDVDVRRCPVTRT